MSSEVAAALIGGIAGLVTGAVASLIAPWVNWGIEQRRLLRQRHSELVEEWRAGIAQLREIERGVSPILPFPGGGQLVMTSGDSDPPKADIHGMEWFIGLRPHLSKKVRPNVDRLGSKRVSDRDHGKLPDVLSGEVDRIEKQWRLI